MSRKIGIFGGTFNPVHNGHISLVKHYYTELGLDEIIVIPSNISPHKTNETVASCQDRLNMLYAAFSKYDFVSVSDIEIKLGGTSYTVNTLTELKKIYPNDELFLIVGGDMFLCFDKWKDYQKILSMCTLCSAPREDNEYRLMQSFQSKIDPENVKTIIVNADYIEVSSSQIRKNIHDNKHYLPTKVYEYIVQKDLYNND